MADDGDKQPRPLLPGAPTTALRADSTRDRPAARVGDRAFFAPDSLHLKVVAVGPRGVTSRVTGPPGAPELGHERTVSGPEWKGMFDEGTLRGLPEPPRPGERWLDRGGREFTVVEADRARAVLVDEAGRTMEVPLGPDGLPADRVWWRLSAGEDEDSPGEGH
jgi:hypothetical protein